jgi:hypothetical protein
VNGRPHAETATEECQRGCCKIKEDYVQEALLQSAPEKCLGCGQGTTHKQILMVQPQSCKGGIQNLSWISGLCSYGARQECPKEHAHDMQTFNSCTAYARTLVCIVEDSLTSRGRVCPGVMVMGCELLDSMRERSKHSSSPCSHSHCPWSKPPSSFVN